MTGNERSDMRDGDAEAADDGRRSEDYAALDRLLKGALAEPPEPRIQFLPAVQARIRQRTRGRYYQDKPRALRDPTLLILAAACLVLVLAAFLYLTLEPLL